jgi:hypothetical protein
MAERIAATVASIRTLALRKAPSVSESIDWARTLLALGISELNAETATSTLNVLLKYQTDIEKVAVDLNTESGHPPA